MYFNRSAAGNLVCTFLISTTMLTSFAPRWFQNTNGTLAEERQRLGKRVWQRKDQKTTELWAQLIELISGEVELDGIFIVLCSGP